ncbi:hypothetical protein [Flexibacterium corallicola]|uniref:hypothetical protein n=1 Tax=Flexibacterium corallicola TaxID=3037259 RepID=UPI00286EE5C6|nr:hypothetical protein [Pseudovibrio sp. M1P-2-3]
MRLKWLRLLAQKHIDIKINNSPHLKTRIVERPGLWMTSTELDRLREDLHLIAGKTLDAKDLEYGVFSKDIEILEHVVITVIYRRADNHPIAFNALRFMPCDLGGVKHEVLHLGLVMVDPEEQRHGLSWVLYGLTCFLLFLRNQFRPLWVSNVTQVPAVVGMVSNTFSQVYPNPGEGTRQSLMHLLLSRSIMMNHRSAFGVDETAGFKEHESVITDAYTGGSDSLKKRFVDATSHRDPVFNAYCKEVLDYERGDDVLQIGKIDLAAAQRYIRDQVPRKSLRSLLTAACFVLLQRLLLPVLHWFDSSRNWKTLRPQ